ncbi:MAG: ABC transporter permease [Mahellales bacterium]
MSVIRYFVNNMDKILTYTMEHLVLIIIAIVISLLIWISVGIAIRNNGKLAKGFLGIGSFIMAVPSVALYGILITIPAFGLNRRSAVLALVLYSMLPILRNVYIALNEVDSTILEAAKGMGMPKRKILFKVQLPLAAPVILAGIRVALVMMVGIATLAVYIGERNLGMLIEQGIKRTHMDMIIVGAVMVSIFSILIDYGIGKLEKHLISPGLLDQKNVQLKGKEVE